MRGCFLFYGDRSRDRNTVAACSPGYRPGEDGALLFGEPQSVGEGSDGVRIGTLPLAALEHANGLGGKPGPRGELLLCEPDGFAQSPEPHSERSSILPGCLSWRPAFRHAVSIPAASSRGEGQEAGSHALEHSECSSSVPAVWMVRRSVQRQTSRQRTGLMRREEDAVQKITDRGAWLDWMEIGALDASEIEEVLDVTARGMRDNPLTVAVFGDGTEQRRQRFRRFMGRVARVLGWGPNMLVARDADGEIAGLCNMMPPGECLPSPSQQLRMLPSLLSNGPYIAGHTMRWLGLWIRRDPAERHWHLGPLVVDGHLQGMG